MYLPKRLISSALVIGACALVACGEEPVGPREPAPGVAKATANSPAFELKFREALRVRDVAGNLRSTNGGLLDGMDRVLAAYGNPEVRPLFTLSVAVLEQLAREARDHSGGTAPDAASWYRVVPRAADASRLLAELNALPEVDTAYAAPTPAPPPGRLAPLSAGGIALVTADFTPLQGYLGQAPQGIEATYARTQPGGAGQGVTVVDLEYDWNFAHEDLGLPPATLIGGQRYTGFGDDHGTAVLGELFGRANGFGVSGGVFSATPRTVGAFFNGQYNPANAVAVAAANMAVGDVLLIEQQAVGPNGAEKYVPLEWIPSVYDAIRLATQAGKIVVEAGGNGAQNLDAPEFNGRFNRQQFDSRALIVGAGNAQHAILSFSDYGTRVDLQGWGIGVVTTGYGDFSGTTKADYYTDEFSGTSSASPIVAAAAAAVQGYVKAQGKPALSPSELRSLLISTGTPQTGDLSRSIGPLPNLRAAFGASAVHNIWVDKAVIPTARSAFALGSASNNLIYAIGGKSNGTILRSVYAYDATTNAWTSKSLLPAARYDGNGAWHINGVLYLAGGRNGSGALTKTLYAYGIGSNTWAAKAPLPILSGCGGTVGINNLLYVLTGCDSTSAFKGVLHRYTPSSNTWTARATAPTAHGYPAVGVIGGQLYVAGGKNASGVVIAALHVYNPATNVWSTKAAMPQARFGAAGRVVNGKFYVVGGTGQGSDLAVTLVYDPTTNLWSTKAAMATARTGLGAGSILGLLYAVGGRGGVSDLTKVERYTP